MYIIQEAMSLTQAQKVFGIDNIPDLETLKNIHKKLVIKHHPDRGGDLTTMQNVNAAFDLLKKNTGVAGTTKATRFNWDEVYAKNKIKFGLMRDFFAKTFDVEKFKSYLENIFEASLSYKVVDNTPKEFFKGKGITDSQYSTFYNAEIHFYTEDKKTYFAVNYSISDVTPQTGALGSSEIDERDIMYSISSYTSIFYQNKKVKLSQNSWNYQYNIGIKKFLDPKELFPEVKIKKALSKSTTKAFKKADMMLGLKRELDASFDKENIFLYPFGKDAKYYIRIYRTTFNRVAAYTIGNIWYIDPTTKKYTSYRFSTKHFSFYENEEEYNWFIEATNRVAKEVEKKKLDLIEDSNKINKMFDDSYDEFRKQVYKKYDL